LIRAKKNNFPEINGIARNSVLRELNRLSCDYYIISDVCLSLNWPVKYRKTQEIVKFCQIDFVVIGPTGIFLIEAKEWSEKILREDMYIPFKEADKAGLIFYIKIINRFNKKFPIYNVVVMLQKVPKIQYEYVRHVSLQQLYWFILQREGILHKKKITKTVRWLSKVSNKKANIRTTTI